MTGNAPPVACLGEAILDLVCERWLADDEEAGPFVPHAGGAPANVAAIIARQGVSASLVGGVGTDRWGEWLRNGLELEGVDTSALFSVGGLATPVALITFDSTGEPTFDVHGEDVGPAMGACRPALAAAVGGACALVLGGNTMVGEAEREVTRAAVELALDRGVPVLIDPNHRPGRWNSEEQAADYARELTALSTVVKANRAEAALLTGEEDPTRSAAALLELGPRLAVVTDGAGPVVVEGACSGTFRPQPVEVVSPLGAGDAFMGGLVAGLASGGWDLGRALDLVPEACRLAGLCCQTWGARS